MSPHPARCCHGLRLQAGFGLVEMLIVVAMVGILASIALPSYSGAIAKGRRAEGRATLVQTAQWLERVATANGSYPAQAALPAALFQGGGPHYRLAVTMQSAGAGADAPVTGYTLDAVPIGAQAHDRCGTLTLLQTGEHQISHAAPDATVDACWNR